MLDTPLPPRRYTTADYANVSTDAVGKPIPVGYGTLTNLTPREIDTTTNRYKALDQAIAEFTEIRSATKTLVKDLDYTEYLSLAEFVIVKPVYLNPASTYYVAIDADYPQSGTNYVGLKRNANGYANGTSYTIDSGDSWTADGDDYDLLFVVYGKQSGTASEEVIATNTASDATADIGLKDSEPNTKVGFSFMPSVSSFMTRAVVYVTKHGTTTGYGLRANLYSDTSGTQVDQNGDRVLISSGVSTLNLTRSERNENEVLECDVKAPGTEMNQADDILKDVIEVVLDRTAGLLDSTELANLATDKTEVLKVLLKDETTFGEFVGKLEAGQMWKLVPLQNGTYGTIVYETGEPANTPHFFDHDFLSFRMELDSSEIMRTVNVLYDEDEETGVFLTRTQSSDIAKFFYRIDKSHEVETFLVSGTNADTLASAYLARYEVPIITVVFEVHGWALDLLPGRDKVKLTRTRAAYAGGTLSAVLFRIVKLVKRPETNVVEITACRWGDATT